MAKKSNTLPVYFGIFIALLLLVIYLVLRYSFIEQPDISSISCTDEVVIEHFEHCVFGSIRSDECDNLYLVLTDLEHDATYIIEMNRSGDRISSFCFPYGGALFVYITPKNGELIFYRARAGITYLFSNTGELIEETTIADLGLDIDLVTQDPRELNLSNGSHVKIIREKGKYQLISTDEEGNSITLLKQTN